MFPRVRVVIDKQAGGREAVFPTVRDGVGSPGEPDMPERVRSATVALARRADSARYIPRHEGAPRTPLLSARTGPGAGNRPQHGLPSPSPAKRQAHRRRGCPGRKVDPSTLT